jgi:hypothetical protein
MDRFDALTRDIEKIPALGWGVARKAGAPQGGAAAG